MYTDDQRRIILINILKEIHKRIPKRKFNTRKVADFEIRNGSLERKKINRLIIDLRSSGCKWTLEENGGCFMCGHVAGTTQGEGIDADDYINQFETIISSLDFSHIPMVCIYNAGSFFNNLEVPIKARDYVYKKLGSLDKIEHVILESRPEFIIDTELKRLRDLLPDKRIEIGVGLESSHEYIRQVCLNKGNTVSEFLKAADMIKRNNISLLSYILLKPPFLTESAAIDDSINSIAWAFRNGADVVSIEPVSVQQFSLVDLLYKMNLFRPPWVWSVLEVIIKSHGQGTIRIGGFEFFPPPSVYTHNCSLCNQICADAIEAYNATGDLTIIEQAYNMECKTCKNDWRTSLLNRSNIADNIDEFLRAFDINVIDRYLGDDYRVDPNDLVQMESYGSLGPRGG